MNIAMVECIDIGLFEKDVNSKIQQLTKKDFVVIDIKYQTHVSYNHSHYSAMICYK